MRSDRRTTNIDADILQLLFHRVQEKAIRRGEEEKHAADRHQRRAFDALRSRIKHLEPPVRVTDTWDQVQSRVEKYEEYRALESDDLRQTAFDKVIRRLKEKEEDADKDRDSRDRRRDYHDRDRDRHRGDRRRSRSPEPDAYEADRRRAQADRERSYNKDRDRDSYRDRYRERERGDRMSHYERERRDREDERERLYRTRGDPRGSRDELDYGGDAPSTTSNERRRRRDSDTESTVSRSVKRYRRDSRERERSRGSRKERIAEEPIQEAAAVHSGSEEGEIEED